MIAKSIVAALFFVSSGRRRTDSAGKPRNAFRKFRHSSFRVTALRSVQVAKKLSPD